MEKLNLLILEDNRDDVALIRKALERSGLDFEANVASNEDGFLSAINCGTYDVILTDNSLPQFNATHALRIIKQQQIDVPCIIVSGTVSDEGACKLLKEGACDYILKDRLNRLPTSILNAINNSRLQAGYRKKLEDISKNEAVMKEAERLANFGSWENDVANGSHYWSDEYYRILGYQPGEVVPSKESLIARIHPADIENVVSSVNYAKKHLTNLPYSFRIMPGKGLGTKYVENEIFITRDSNGKIIRINGVMRDVTDKKQAEERIIKSEQKYHNLFKHNPIPMWVIDADTLRFYDVNDAAVCHYGYSAEEFLSMTATDIRPEEEKDRFLKLDRNKHSFGNIGLWKHRKKDGTIILVEATVDTILYDGKKSILVLAHDVTEKTQAENKLKHSEHRLKQAQAIAHIGNWELDLATGIAIWSEEECLMHGYATHENKQSFEVWRSFIHPEDVERVLHVFDAARTSMSGAGYVYRIILRDGRVRHIYSQFEFETNEQGEAIAAYGISHDITEAKESENKLRHTTQRLNQAQATAHVGSWDLNYSTGVALWTSEACRIFGLPETENIQNFESWKSFVHPDDLTFVLAKVDEARSGLSEVDLTYRIIRKDGTARYVNSKFTFELNEQGIPSGQIGTVHDITEHKKADNQLQHATDRLKQAQAIAHVGSWELDLSTGIGLWSEESCRIYGVSPEDNIQSFESWKNFIHPDDLEHVLAVLEKSNATLAETDFVHRIVWKDGTIRHINSRFAYEVDEHGVPTGILGTNHDITEAREAENRLRRTTERLKQAQKVAHIGSWDLDFTTNTLHWSDQTCKTFGLSPDENLQTFDSWLTFVHPDDLLGVLKKIDDARPALKSTAFSYRIVRKDGSIRHVFMQSEYNISPAGAPLGVYGVIHDITETTVAQQALVQSEANLRLIMDLLPQSISVRDGDGNFIFVNNSFSKMYGIEAEKLIGASVRATIPAANEADTYIERDREIIRSGITRTLPGVTFCDITGAHRIFNVTKVPYQPAGTTGMAILGIAHDITEQKNAELERIQMTEDIFQRNRDLEEFSYIVSHSLRAPVANILGITSILDFENTTEEEKNYLMEGLTESVKRLDDVIMDLNNVTRIKHSITENKQLISFSKLASHIINDHAMDKNVSIQVDFREADSFEAVSNYMHSIFYNLISNSIKYKKPGEEMVCEIKSRRKADHLELTFKDNGTGIDLCKTGDQVFELYKRYHIGAKEGKGMGLFMVKAHVENLGGRIRVASEVGKGTEFTIEFPLTQRELAML